MAKGVGAYYVPLPELDSILRKIHGVFLYQEQVLEVAKTVAGFNLAETDGLGRAMTKDRGPRAMDGMRREFVRRATVKGVSARNAREVFAWMKGFAAYSFSAAHAASFASISYASAYMRTHYPAELFCALLDSQPMGFYSPRVLLNEARRIQLSVLESDIHLAGECFTVEEDGTTKAPLGRGDEEATGGQRSWGTLRGSVRPGRVDGAEAGRVARPDQAAITWASPRPPGAAGA